MKLPQLDDQNKEELSMIEVAIAVLEVKGDVMYFNDLLEEVSNYLDMSDVEVEQKRAQFYTDINSRGNFISPIDSMWGLREWYPIDAINEELTYKNDETNVHTKIANDGFDEIVEEEDEDDDQLFTDNGLNDDDDDDEKEKDSELDEYENDLEKIALNEDDEETEDTDELDDLTILDEDDIDEDE